MAGVLLDTNILSELTRPHPHTSVVTFLELVEDAFLSVVTIHEVTFGIQRLPPGRRRRELEYAVGTLRDLYADRVLALHEAEAERAADLRADATSKGHTLHLADALIAATALVHDLTLATRNTGDFVKTSVRIFNPWDAGHAI